MKYNKEDLLNLYYKYTTPQPKNLDLRIKENIEDFIENKEIVQEIHEQFDKNFYDEQYQYRSKINTKVKENKDLSSIHKIKTNIYR